jgi:hypothetical protein
MYKIARRSPLTSYSSDNFINYMTEEGINIKSYSSDLMLCKFWLSDTIERSSTD